MKHLTKKFSPERERLARAIDLKVTLIFTRIISSVTKKMKYVTRVIVQLPLDLIESTQLNKFELKATVGKKILEDIFESLTLFSWRYACIILLYPQCEQNPDFILHIAWQYPPIQG